MNPFLTRDTLDFASHTMYLTHNRKNSSGDSLAHRLGCGMEYSLGEELAASVNGYTGIIYDEGGVAGGRGIMSKRGEKTVWDAENKRTSTPLDKSDDEIKAMIKPVGEWNDATVIADGNHITYSINGQVTTEMIDNSPKACKDGVIGLQMHGGHTMTLQFKDIKIRMLEKK